MILFSITNRMMELVSNWKRTYFPSFVASDTPIQNSGSSSLKPEEPLAAPVILPLTKAFFGSNNVPLSSIHFWTASLYSNRSFTNRRHLSWIWTHPSSQVCDWTRPKCKRISRIFQPPEGIPRIEKTNCEYYSSRWFLSFFFYRRG